MLYKKISSANDLIKELKQNHATQNINGSEYYYFKENNNIIISNVPKKLYEKKLKKYNKPNNVDTEFIKLLKQNFDLFHNHSQTESFQLNKCFENSVNVFEFLKQLDNDDNFNIFSPVKIVYGYFSREIPLNTIINDKIITQKFIIHDWHVWNYINNFLIDVSLLKNGTFLGVEVDTPISWGKTDDHVFVSCPNGVEYYGIDFDNRHNFIDDFRGAFNV
jgi:hypothetical protein